jgi:hypothetical protein
MSALLQKLHEAETTAKAAAEDAFQQLAIQIASGTDDPAFDEVQQVLASAGRNAAELSSQVAYQQRRAEHREALAAAADADDQRPLIDAAIAKANSELEAATQRHAITVGALTVQLQAANEIHTKAATAKRELYHGCTDQKLRSQERSNKAATINLESKIRQTQDALDKQRANLRAANSQPKQGWELTSAVEPGSDAVVYVGRIERLQGELNALTQEQERLLAEAEKIYQSILEA